MRLFGAADIQTKYGIFLNPEDIQDKYGVFEPTNTTTTTSSNYSNLDAPMDVTQFTTKYGANAGITEPTLTQKIASIGKFAVPVVLFSIGVFVVISKKFTTKIKIITCSCLAALAVGSYFLLDYLSKNI